MRVLGRFPQPGAPLEIDGGRTIRLADLLIEVENDLGFSVHFQQPGEKWVDPGEVCALLAAILAHGCNLGLYTMEKVAPDIAYRRLKYVSDWRLVEENQRAALAAIVHGISRLDAAGHWGDGTTSASDGQRFAMPHKVLQRTYSTRFNDFALEFYSFVADNYAPFYSRPIECTDRDAPFVLDGVLYHESDLNLEEHYTDTHGYTEINFAAFGMIGMRFCPRIRSLHRQRIYCADPARDHGVLEPVLQRGRRAVNFRLIAEQWDRIGQFYAAFPAGHATASAALQRLNRFQASNRFYAANRELGRALKTEFVLQYMSEPKLRAKVAAGPAQGRAAPRPWRGPSTTGSGGASAPREVYDQMNACSCLTPDPRLHRLLAGPGDLTAGRRAGLPVRPRPAASCQPDRVEERHPLRRDQDRPRQAQDATPLACISTRMLSVPWYRQAERRLEHGASRPPARSAFRPAANRRLEAARHGPRRTRFGMRQVCRQDVQRLDQREQQARDDDERYHPEDLAHHARHEQQRAERGHRRQHREGHRLRNLVGAP